MPRRDPAQAVHMLDLLEQFFEGGRRWITGDFHDDDGNRCLVGAMRHLRAVMNLSGDGTAYYLREAQPQCRYIPITELNDSCGSYADIRTLIDRARTLAETEIGAPVPPLRERPWRAPRLHVPEAMLPLLARRRG
jgi:hypothetical protein